MMHRDSGAIDEFETLCSIPAMTVRRLRMREVRQTGKLESGQNESLLIALSGEVTTDWGSGRAELREKDTAYLTKGMSFSLGAKAEADIVWATAPGAKEYLPYVRRFKEISPVTSGSEGFTRRIYTSIGEREEANRFISGFVEGEQGNWTSFPPHRHDGKPEVYVYYGMGKRFGVQVVAGEEDRAFVVREGDAVLFEKGYHPNVATPGVGMNFVWIISADPDDRNLAVELHPEYRELQSGPTHLTVK